MLLALFLLPFRSMAQELLTLPRLEQLSSQYVTQVIQDSEGFLWYATEGGGVCRDDGWQITVFRSDAEHPDLLGSNDVASIAATGRYIIIGTYHGACLLDKQEYSIRRLTEVDDKRVDNIIVSEKNGHWWLTSNKKVYEYVDGKLLKTYPLGDKYIFRLREDSIGQIWATEWEGGLLQLKDGEFQMVSSNVELDSIDFRRVMTDRQGRLLVADGFGKCYALSSTDQESWFNGQILSKSMADGIRDSLHLSARPTALAVPPRPLERGIGDEADLWFSTGKDIRRHCQDGEQIVLPDTKDVSAMTFTADGTLWLATIFGTIMTYKNGRLSTDDYASNEYSDAVTALEVDSLGRLVIVTDHYVRLYDPMRKTLRQQSIEVDGIYRIELQETQPNKRWSHPAEEAVERMPHWVWWVLGVLLVVMLALISYVWFLHRQRKRFMETMRRLPVQEQAVANRQNEETKALIAQAEEQPSENVKDEWLNKAIDLVEQHLSDEHYSVEQLSADLCMSRMTFYRKIQSATGQKPTEFIRTIRLRRAAELLREGRMSITEISYATGFSSVSYFSRCFRTMYSIPPTQFIEDSKNE